MKSLRYASLALLVSLLAGCSGGGGSGKPQVGFVTNNPHEFWKLVEAGCKAQADKDGLDLDFQRPAKGNAAEQKSIIDAMVNKGVKAISVSVLDPENQTSYLDSIATKLPLLAVDNDAPASKRKCYIGTDNVKAGRAVGVLIKEAMKDKPSVTLSLFVGDLASHNARGRIQGVLEELGFEKGARTSKDGKYKLYNKGNDDAYADGTDASKCTDNTIAVLGDNKAEENICLVGLWAYNPPAILNGIKKYNPKLVGLVTVVGFDEDLGTLKAIDDGAIYGTVVQNPYEFGRKAVEVMGKYAKGEKVELPANGIDYIPERIVTKEGGEGRLVAKEYAGKVREMLGQK